MQLMQGEMQRVCSWCKADAEVGNAWDEVDAMIAQLRPKWVRKRQERQRGLNPKMAPVPEGFMKSK